MLYKLYKSSRKQFKPPGGIRSYQIVLGIYQTFLDFFILFTTKICKLFLYVQTQCVFVVQQAYLCSKYQRSCSPLTFTDWDRASDCYVKGCRDKQHESVWVQIRGLSVQAPHNLRSASQPSFLRLSGEYSVLCFISIHLFIARSVLLTIAMQLSTLQLCGYLK